ncbi:unnamed protein product [Candida verbasci]|uniref:Opaque-phase-specific protein OP4 n=1 Tax=Candida verbasci TaxID=1227364 RepID=A0A9W4XL56_9ASCO|nr:unnamed protein product [Candida verbasci]
MKYSTALTLLATLSTISAAPSTTTENVLVKRQVSSLSKREAQDIDALVAHINSYTEKRDAIDMELMRRDYAIVTDVLTAINQTQLAPKILDYFISSPTFEPIIVNVLIAVMKSGVISLQAVLDALVSSNLAVNVINDLISDCSLYVELFNAAEQVISDLANSVKDLIDQGVNSLITRDEDDQSLQPYIVDKRLDLDSVVDNLLDSLYQSGLASSVVRDVLTNSNYLNFAVDLIKAMLANNLINLSSILDALTESGLITQLFQELVNLNTLGTVAETAFAAYSGTCTGSGVPSVANPPSTNTPSTGGNSNSGTNANVSNPCKKRKVRRRKRRSNY